MTSAQVDRVDAWSAVYEEVYTDGHARGTAADGLEGWVDALSGRPLPAEIMWEWRDATVDRLRGLRPVRVLDVGTGTGMIARALASEVRSYHAVDLTLAGVRDLLDDPGRPSGLTFDRRAAHELSPQVLPGDRPDLILLNSVVHYFPDMDYLEVVLTGLLDLLAPGGVLFLGDLRDARRDARRLRERALRSEPWAGPGRLDALVADLARRDRELALDPWEPGRSLGVETTVLARCLQDSDLARYRVDVLLRPEGSAGPGGGARATVGGVAGGTDAGPRATHRWEDLGDDERRRETGARAVLKAGGVVDVPDGLVCPFGPSALEASEWTPAGGAGVHMSRESPDRLILTSRPLAPTGHRRGEPQ
ncbi:MULTISPECIES: bifunctional 2-polyprenyl-6-hydroxyphenol methylase/3-demethylubiquinol 3-O-methyltransferase UbiG [unclassified Dietzia]|uniref:class I SAM-dependent methyltransferase n=3 Tax=Dietzia TaxID=37914 RepID=UPI0012E985A0|nr:MULTISPECIES: methyltransferase domain-containing protein [unclassified Dietzia]QGW24111.1 amino acid adenylation domain-containing protein [Dietzia sp. DQ12-45-1b]